MEASILTYILSIFIPTTTSTVFKLI